MKILTRLFTKNLTKIPLLQITFNWKLFKANGVKAALKEVSGITDEKILDDVVAIYEAM